MATFLIIVAVLWIGALGLWWSWGRARRSADLNKIQARLTGLPEKGKQKQARKGPALIEQQTGQGRKLVSYLLERLEWNEWLRVLFEQAGLKWSVARTIHGALALLLVGFTAVWRTAPAYRSLALPVGLACAALPFLHVWKKRKARLARFEAQFPESLEFLGRSMRAGHAFSVSLEMLHSEFQDPLAAEFRRVFDEQNLGLPLDTALEKLAQRVPLLDVRFFVSAVLLQKRTGGNLAELLDKLASLIRERFKLRGRIRAISAHGRMTGMALSMIPIVVALLMFWVNPGYARFFVEDETGRMMAGGAIGLQLIGYGVIRKIVSIEV